MSGASLDVQEQRVRIDREIARTAHAEEELRKFVAEQHELLAEREKLLAEARYHPAVVALSSFTVGATVIAVIVALMKVLS